MLNCKVYEDNAGYYHIAIIDQTGTCVYYLTDSNRELVMETMTAIANGVNPITEGWEGSEENPDECYKSIENFVCARNGSAEQII